MKNYYLLFVIILLVISCDSRKITLTNPGTSFTVRVYTGNLTVPVNSKNLLTIEIHGNNYNTYTMRFVVEGNGILYDKNMLEVGQNIQVATNDEFYFEPKITGNFEVVFEVENNPGEIARDELALVVSE